MGSKLRVGSDPVGTKDSDGELLGTLLGSLEKLGCAVGWVLGSDDIEGLAVGSLLGSLEKLGCSVG